MKFTGKERDAEAGLDYFGARYMASAQGRWTSPDRINITRARMLSPTNTLNKYAYAANNPLKFIDPDGNDVTVFYRRDAFYSGHVMMAAMNQKTGRVGVADFFTTAGEHKAMFGKPRGEALSTIQSPSELRDYASITIQTTPELAEKVLDWMAKLQANPPPYNAFTSNCTTACVEALQVLGLSTPDGGLASFTPDYFWDYLFPRYSSVPAFSPWHAPAVPGTEYGRPRYPGMTTRMTAQLYMALFQFETLRVIRKEPRACVEVTDSATGTTSKSCEP